MHHVLYCIDEIRAEIDAMVAVSGNQGAARDQSLVPVKDDCARFQRAQQLLDELISVLLVDAATAVDSTQPLVHPTAETSCVTGIFDLPTDALELEKVEDNLCLINGISEPDLQILAQCQLRSFQDIAAMMLEDIDRLVIAGFSHQRVAEENWIEQAAILASGATTDYARRVIEDRVPKCVEMTIVQAPQMQGVLQVELATELPTCVVLPFVQGLPTVEEPKVPLAQAKRSSWALRIAASLVFLAMTSLSNSSTGPDATEVAGGTQIATLR
jgi:predicted flap endonuclease-1-like 5' DNA nuclease